MAHTPFRVAHPPFSYVTIGSDTQLDLPPPRHFSKRSYTYVGNVLNHIERDESPAVSRNIHIAYIAAENVRGILHY